VGETLAALAEWEFDRVVDAMRAQASDAADITVSSRPPTHRARNDAPPPVPVDAPVDLVWLEWDVWCDESSADIHPRYHHRLGHVTLARGGTPHPMETFGPPAVLTRIARARSLGAAPCSRCFESTDS
jgi:hypothetical protein